MKNTLSIAALLGMLSIILGAFGAHALKSQLTADMLAVFETGVRYQFYHTLALIVVTILYQLSENKKYILATRMFYAGILLFSGSLYALSLSSIGGSPIRLLGAITPIGGVCFILGWLFVFLAARSSNFKQKN
jgi:uncharacterized membrane protein YgdD (TMEM256/DUF423 family)